MVTLDEADKLLALDEIVMEIIAVDDFESSELGTKAKPLARSKPRIKVANFPENVSEMPPATGRDAHPKAG